MRNLQKALSILINNFNLISRIVLTIWLPGSIVIALLNIFVFPAMTNNDELNILMLEMRVTNAIELAFGPIYIGALIHALSQINLGIQPNYKESIKQGLKQCFKLFVTRLSSGLIVLLGFIAFIIPGIILSLQYALIDMAVVLENKQGRKARKLSRNLTQGRKLRIFAAGVITFILIMVFNTIFISIINLPLVFLSGWQVALLINVMAGCVASITFALLTIVFFEFYCDAKKTIEITSE